MTTQPTIPMFKVFMALEATQAVERVFASGMIGQGPEVEHFEAELETILGAPVLTVNSCTSAIDLALHLIGVGPGDEVVTTAQTCTATNTHIGLRGAKAVWADIDPATGNIDPKSVERCLSPKTKAIIAVDWAGRPCDYEALRQYGLPVIEDAAHAFLAQYRGESIARSGGDYVCWSFQAIKHLTTVDGGALKVPADQLDRARLLRWYGFDRRSSADFRCAQDLKELGFKYHMNDVAAAIGRANLTYVIDEDRGIVARHRALARRYWAWCWALQHIALPPPDDNSAWWLYTVRVADRKSFQAFMRSRGIDTSEVHRRNDLHSAFKECGVTRVPLPGLEAFSAEQVSIPLGWWVDDAQAHRVASALFEWDKVAMPLRRSA